MVIGIDRERVWVRLQPGAGVFTPSSNDKQSTSAEELSTFTFDDAMAFVGGVAEEVA